MNSDKPVNKRNMIICKLVAFFFILCFALGASFSVTIAEENQEAPIRVGYDTSGRYLYQDANGEFRGFTIEYLYEITKYTRWQYTFVPFNSWADAVQALRDGKIDVLPTMLKTPERENQMLFSTEKMGEIYLAVIVPRDNDNHAYGDLSFLKDGKIGVRRDTQWMPLHSLIGLVTMVYGIIQLIMMIRKNYWPLSIGVKLMQQR